MQWIWALHPLAIVGPSGLTSLGYTLEMLDNELSTMAMLCVLPCKEYAAFISSVLLLNGLTKETILKAFQTEETQQRATREEVDAVAATAACTISCYICDGPHKVQDCSNLPTACENAKKTDTGAKPKKHGNRHGTTADAAKAADTPKVEEGCDGPAVKVEVAVCQSATSPFSPSDLLWNTDSGTSAHMMPHHKWFSPDSFKPWRVPIYLANNMVVYFKGKGDVLIRPAGKNRNGGALNNVIITNILLQGHTQSGVFIGYTNNYVGWHVYIPSTKKIVISCDVIFDGTCFPGLKLATHQMPPLMNAFDSLEDYTPYNSDDIITPILPPPPVPPVPGKCAFDNDELLADLDTDIESDAAETVGVDVQHSQDQQVLVGVGNSADPQLPVPQSTRKTYAEYCDALLCQENQESPLICKPPLPLLPSPYPEPPLEQPLWNIDVVDANEHGEQEVALVLNVDSDDALLLPGRTFVEHGADFGGYDALSTNATMAYKVGTHNMNPCSYKEAMASNNAAEWHKAMCDKMNTLKSSGTWWPAYLPTGCHAIGLQWVCKVKHLPNDTIDRFKAHLIAQGFSQQPGVDFDKMFAPTAHWAAVQTVLALAAVDDMHLESVDISSAFLHGIVDMELYMKFPEGFPEDVLPDIKHQPGKGDVCAKLLKSIYGLKQGANLWHKCMHEVFLSIGFSHITSDPCIYVYIRNNVRIIIPIHVDDMTLASKSRPAILKVIAEPAQHRGHTRQAKPQALDQPEILCYQGPFSFNMLDSKAVVTPLAPGTRLSKADSPSTPEEVKEMHAVPYVQATGALLYLAMCMQPDIAFAVSMLCRFNACPGPKHWQAVKHLLRYVCRTLDYKIEYSAHAVALPPSPFITFANTDHGGNPNTGHSTTGSVLMVAGGAVSWISQQQSVIALSTTEAEFIAASETSRELCWLHNFLADIGMPQSLPMVLNIDNQSAISVSRQPKHMGHLKHLDHHWFWLHQAVYDGKLKPYYIPSEDMVVNLLMKPLACPLVDKLCKAMGIIREFSQIDL
ncbi:hypothetical protein E4T56_gene14598 [Termitomyces sp. T112]|nr:hypothetical protein E4T56_gene14598 [Termitomyces sp. T112]